jgi:hypothetical protein
LTGTCNSPLDMWMSFSLEACRIRTLSSVTSLLRILTFEVSVILPLRVLYYSLVINQVFYHGIILWRFGPIQFFKYRFHSHFCSFSGFFKSMSFIWSGLSCCRVLSLIILEYPSSRAIYGSAVHFVIVYSN